MTARAGTPDWYFAPLVTTYGKTHNLFGLVFGIRACPPNIASSAMRIARDFTRWYAFGLLSERRDAVSFEEKDLRLARNFPLCVRLKL
jgi:hypothetical protein